jgi:hypothetical protein
VWYNKAEDTPFTPQENGVAERMNIKLMEKERTYSVVRKSVVVVKNVPYFFFYRRRERAPY